MKQTFTFLLCLFLSNFYLSAQTTVDFEDFLLEQDSFLNGSDGSGGFDIENAFLPNNYNAAWMSWSGWSISNNTNVTTPGFTNQHTSISGSGFEGSENYAVAFVSGQNIIELKDEAAGEVVNGFYINNNTYAYFSMRDGDQFAKKFGGETGDDPDYFLLTIKKYLDGELSTDSIDFYLADYRFADNSEDYIVDEWTYVDLTSLGKADSLVFTMFSTDGTPMFGPNTPAYFCMDNFSTSDGVVSTSEVGELNSFEIYPNPTVDYVIVRSSEIKNTSLTVFDLSGRQLMYEVFSSDQQQIDLSELNSGAFVLLIQNEEVAERVMILKQ